MPRSTVLDRPVIIASSGRCGSTLLQAILNTNPEFLIWGEHQGVLSQLAGAYFTAFGPIPGFPDELGLTADQRIARLRDTNRLTSWDNLFDREGFTETFRNFLRSMFADPTGRSPRWGFKEIRYGRGRRDLVLPLFRALFPEVRFVFMIREPYATLFSMLSAWFYVRTNRVPLNSWEADDRLLRLANLWARTYSFLHVFLQAYPSQASLVRYEDLRRPATYETLARFLDTSVSFDYASHLGTVKDPAVQDDETAAFLRERMSFLQAKVERIIGPTRRAYGYI